MSKLHLKSIKEDRLREILPTQDVKKILANKDQIFEIPDEGTDPDTDAAIDIEIAVRKCERFGVFKQ